MHSSKRGFCIASMLFLVVFLTAGCGLFGSEGENWPTTGESRETGENDPMVIDPSAVQWEDEVKFDTGDSEEKESNPGETTAVIDETTTLTLYFLDSQDYVVPMAMEVPKVEGIAKQALTFMMKGGPGEELLPDGFSAIVPPDSDFTVHTEEGLAIIDFSPAFNQIPEGQEKKVLEAITYAMTEFPTVEKVDIRINGYPLNEMQNGYPVSLPLSRESLGINLELSDDARIGRTSPVTLYFQGVNQAGESYLVPVTRLVPRMEDQKTLANKTLQELIEGPDPDSGLSGFLMDSLKVLQVDIQDSLVTANLDEYALQILPEDSGQLSPALQSMILSLTENVGASAVQLMINGEEAVTVGGIPLDQPLARPAWVNPI